MEHRRRSFLNDEQWTTIRDFATDDAGNPLPKYEAKLVEDVDKPYLDPDVVLVKRTDPFFEGELTYPLPRVVVEGITDDLRR